MVQSLSRLGHARAGGSAPTRSCPCHAYQDKNLADLLPTATGHSTAPPRSTQQLGLTSLPVVCTQPVMVLSRTHQEHSCSCANGPKAPAEAHDTTARQSWADLIACGLYQASHDAVMAVQVGVEVANGSATKEEQGSGEPFEHFQRTSQALLQVALSHPGSQALMQGSEDLRLAAAVM